jgi:hypothetical protein
MRGRDRTYVRKNACINRQAPKTQLNTQSRRNASTRDNTCRPASHSTLNLQACTYGACSTCAKGSSNNSLILMTYCESAVTFIDKNWRSRTQRTNMACSHSNQTPGIQKNNHFVAPTPSRRIRSLLTTEKTPLKTPSWAYCHF